MTPKSILLCNCVCLLIDLINAVQFVVSGNLERRNEFACHTQVILQCIVDPMTDPVVWQIGKPVVPTTAIAAECSGLSCDINPQVSSIYGFSYNDNFGIANLTITNVTLAEDGKQYKCDDGSSPSPLPFESIVQVPPVKENTRISNASVSEVTTQITVKTGCVSQNTAQLIRFKWFTVKEGSTQSSPYTTNTSTISNEAPCMEYSDCVTNGSAEIWNSFTIDEDENSQKVFFQVQILLDDTLLFTIKSKSTFQPKRFTTTTPTSKTNSAKQSPPTIQNKPTTSLSPPMKDCTIYISVAGALVITVIMR